MEESFKPRNGSGLRALRYRCPSLWSRMRIIDHRQESISMPTSCATDSISAGKCALLVQREFTLGVEGVVKLPPKRLSAPTRIPPPSATERKRHLEEQPISSSFHTFSECSADWGSNGRTYHKDVVSQEPSMAALQRGDKSRRFVRLLLFRRVALQQSPPPLPCCGDLQLGTACSPQNYSE
jgi:hypothetical protein